MNPFKLFRKPQGPTVNNRNDRNGMGSRFDPSSDTLCADNPQAYQSHLPGPYHVYTATPSHGAYYQQQPGVFFVPVNPGAPPQGMSSLQYAHERPRPSHIDTHFDGQGPPPGANLATPITPMQTGQSSNSAYGVNRRNTMSTTSGHEPPSATSSIGPGWPRSSHNSRFSMYSPLAATDLHSLRRHDLVFLVSDSPTMGLNGKWPKCRELLAQLTRVAMQYDTDGVEIHFLNMDSERSEGTFTSEEDVEALFESVAAPSGSSRLSDKLDPLISEYRAQLQGYLDGHPAKPWRTRPVPKKAIYVVLTDGNHSDTENIFRIIYDMATYLDRIHAPATQFGIEFVQIGEGNEFFEWLDRGMYQEEKVRDIVRTESYNGGTLDTIQLGTMLLGSVNGNA